MVMEYRENQLLEPLLKAEEVAQILNVSRAFVYHLMKHGKLRAVVIEGARRVRPSDLKMYIEENLSKLSRIHPQ